MSWFTSLFSPAPKTSASSTVNPESQPSPVQPEPKRLLEEPITSTQPRSLTEPNVQSSQRFQHTPPVDNPNRNKIIFGAGVAFFGFSLLVTRRAFVRKRLASMPTFYADAPAHHIEQSSKVSGAKEALDALNLATLNVTSLAIMVTGGAMWYMDINNIEDARRLLRGGMGVDGTGRTEKDAEEDFEEWMATVLARKEAKQTASPRTNALVNERGQQR